MPAPPATVKEPSPALDLYAKWRPRLKRSAQWAIPVGAIGKAVGGETRHVLPMTIAAGIAGAADATLEERLRQNRHPEAKKIVQRAFTDKKAAAQDPSLVSPEVASRADAGSNGVLGLLFAHKDEVGRNARAQFQSLLPDGARPDSYGRVARLQPGSGAVSALLESVHPRSR